MSFMYVRIQKFIGSIFKRTNNTSTSIVKDPAVAKHMFNLQDKFHITRPKKGRRGRDRMIVRFTTTYVISAYHR
jgi:hypothetical protein